MTKTKSIASARMSNIAAVKAWLCIEVGTRTEAANKVMNVARAVVEKQATRQLRIQAGFLWIAAMVKELIPNSKVESRQRCCCASLVSDLF